MNRLLLVLWLSLLSFQSEGMFVYGGGMQKPTVDFYYSSDSPMRLHPVTVEAFVQEADNLYISMDEFRDLEKRHVNATNYSGFIRKYMFCIIMHQEYGSALVERIIPDYKKLVEEDAACETAGIYSDEEVEAFVGFLRERLNCLYKLDFLGTLVKNCGG